MVTFPSIYQRSVLIALISQIITGLLAILTIMDVGRFAVLFLGLSCAFWIFAGIFMLKRQSPSFIERFLIASGPMLIFGVLFFVG